MWFGNIKMPIRWRLVVLSTIGLIGILILFHIFVYVLLKNWLIGTEESVLRDKLISIQKVYDQEAFSSLPYSAWLPSMIEEGQAVRLIRNKRVIASVNKGISETVFLPMSYPNKKEKIEKYTDREVLVLTMPLDRGKGRMELYSDYSSSGKYISSMITALVIASSVLLVFVVIGGYVMSTIAFRPVKMITKAVQEFDPARPTHRLKVPNTGDEIALLSRVFNSLLDRIYDLIKKQNRFVSDVSHELRTPIAVVRGYLNLLRRWGMKKPDVAEEALSTMDEELTRIEKMTERLLKLARLEMEEPVQEPETFNITSVIAERVKRWQQVHRELEIVYDARDEELECRSYQADLEELLDILLDNAGKYTEEGGRITVKLRGTPKRIRIVVRDTGQGISAADLPFIFDRFYRAKRQRKNTGSGLGLSIALELVKKMGGELDIKSQLGKGTAVIIMLPRF
jgi:two-component system, OmpR family, sensor histidine kinase ArlS